MKLKTTFIITGLFALMFSCTQTSTNETENAENKAEMRLEIETLEDSTMRFDERMEASDKKIDTLENQIDSLLKDI